MINVKKLFVNPNDTIKKALEIIDKGAIKIALVIDENEKLLGTLSDGDIRRAILKGKELDDTIEDIYFKNPTVIGPSHSKEDIINLSLSKKIYQIPIVDEHKRVIGLKVLDELLKPKEYPHKVVLMVGGLGTRLRPLTEHMPKPLLKVGEKPILQRIIEQFALYGFKNFIFCVNYRADHIVSYFQNGQQLGVNIEYIFEKKRLGTVGALSLFKKPIEPFFVMNGDILTNVDFEALLNYHLENRADATVCVRKYSFEVPYGVVNLDTNKITSIEEKPRFDFFVSGGIYMFNPDIIEFIPKDSYLDMPILIESLIERNKHIVSFPIREYWLDIGRLEDYQRANVECKEKFNV